MLKSKHILKAICTAIYIVKISLSLKLNDLGVCKITHNGTGTTQLRCCINYRLHPTKDACISCPNGTFGENCEHDCADNYYGFQCLSECNCSGNETCYKATGCEVTIYGNYENSDTKTNNTTLVLIVTLVAVVLVVTVLVSWKSRHRLKSIHLLQGLFLGTQPVSVQGRHKTSNIDIEDDDQYSEIRESMMVRPMTVYGRKFSIRSPYGGSDDLDDQKHRSELAMSLRSTNLTNSTNESTDSTDPIDEPFLQTERNIYEQLIIDESLETKYAEVAENHYKLSSLKKLNTFERSEKFDLVTEIDNTADTERETTAYPMLMPPNTYEIANKTGVCIEVQDNTTYAKVVKDYNNECSSKIHLNTTGILDKLNFVTGTNINEEIRENSTKYKDHNAEIEGEMTTDSESESEFCSLPCEEDNSNITIELYGTP